MKEEQKEAEQKLQLTALSKRELEAIRVRTAKREATGLTFDENPDLRCECKANRFKTIQNARKGLRETIAGVLDGRNDEKDGGPITIGGL